MNIALLLSGGVDSAVALHLLYEQGFRPDLYYIKIGMDTDDLTCTAEEDIELSEATARRYGLKLEVVDLQKEYWDRVVAYTMEHVKQGLTPNPDVMCNKLIKFGAFEEKVGYAYDRIATGHYARVLTTPSLPENAPVEGFDLSGARAVSLVEGKELTAYAPAAETRWLGTAPDPVKDQTDFLAQLSLAQMDKIMLPIGHLMKDEVRSIALDAKLPPARRKDSQGICFLGKINYSDFVRRFLGERPGPVIEIESGRKIGEHRGYWFHTIGQRKGLGLGGGPWFVVKKDIEKNILYVSRGYDTILQYNKAFTLAGFHFLTADPWPLEGEFDVTFKVRHTDRFRKGKLYRSNGEFRVVGDDMIQGVAPGQFGVVYDAASRVCIGSGEISV